MLDILLVMMLGIIRLERHAIIAHGVHAMLAEAGVAGARNFSIKLTVVGIDSILGDKLPRTLWVDSRDGCIDTVAIWSRSTGSRC